MKYLYDKTSSLTFPNGKTYTAEELRENVHYSILFDYDHVIDRDDDGITYSYQRLAYLKDTLGITEDNPQRALELCIAEQERLAQEAEANRVTLEEKVESLETENALLMEAVAELGVVVAGGAA